MMSSLMPSEKYSCSGSPLMLLNASTAMEGLPGTGGGASTAPVRTANATPCSSTTTQNTSIGRTMFLTV